MFYCAYPVRAAPAGESGCRRWRARCWPACSGKSRSKLFRFYIQRVSLYNEIYGPLAVLVAFAMFVYYSAVVFVFSAAFVARARLAADLTRSLPQISARR